ncbi:hypothetical protein AB1K91_10265 [Terribacillus sp. 179-K 1B1 HS]|uniref:hypothetical protein n=1 Tax=Terribacillus sp. 179-K 1B1 HS TaxID=3142388 RepID=UPI00399F3444
MPVLDINMLFGYENKPELYIDGITIAWGSKFRGLSGAENAGNELIALSGSKAICYMEGLTQGGHALVRELRLVWHFQTLKGAPSWLVMVPVVKAAQSQLQNCTGSYAVYCIWDSDMHVSIGYVRLCKWHSDDH